MTTPPLCRVCGQRVDADTAVIDDGKVWCSIQCCQAGSWEDAPTWTLGQDDQEPIDDRFDKDDWTVI